MYKIGAPTEKSIYELGELAKEFLSQDDFCISEINSSEVFDLVIPNYESKFERAFCLYNFLSEKTGKKQDWGTLVGVRPKKLYSELVNKYGEDECKRKLSEDYKLNECKIKLLSDTYHTQLSTITNSDPHAIGVYIGIPFCPSRCVYCSFTSNKINKKAADAYLIALKKEIDAVKHIMQIKGLYAESIYIGGGTPTALCDEDFETLMTWAEDAFYSDRTAEFCVECGRPDTINVSKLNSVKNHKAGRISINPQSMKQHTLDLIGREHKVEDIYTSYELARSVGDFIINMDLITGLPEETPDDFENTLNEIIKLKPENITVHTLAVKKASRLIEQDKDYNYRHAETVRTMLDYASSKLYENRYLPYYLYRQKHMAGNFENVGYCMDNTASIYNIRIMEENQTIIALGAGGMSKVYYPSENRLERVPNVSNYEIYIERIDEMIQRKESGI